MGYRKEAIECVKDCVLPNHQHIYAKYDWDFDRIYSEGYNSKTSGMKRLPNVISVLRVAGSIGLLFCDVAGWMFWALYALCGISDMVDGWLARRLHAESNTGAILDSVSDILFVACCAIRLSPVLVIPTWLWIWAGIIAIIKIVNQISALIVYKRFCFPHTLANKLTGLLLFLTVPGMFWSLIPVSTAAAIATFAAVQEGHFIRTKQVF